MTQNTFPVMSKIKVISYTFLKKLAMISAKHKTMIFDDFVLAMA